MIEALTTFAALFAGVVASVVAFGIGSILTPVLALEVSTPVAVAAASIPHLLGSSLRLWVLRSHVDWRVMREFGAWSALGGLLGALLQSALASRILTLLFGVVVAWAGIAGLLRLAERSPIKGKWALVAGAASGLLGGLVGNQGGIRTAAMLGLDVDKEVFVASATAVAVAVDLARVPVYIITTGEGIRAITSLVALATLGVVAGTIAGLRWLSTLEGRTFRTMASLTVLALGIYMLLQAL
jgi:uncharacterized membrane protein YfcA